MQFQVGLKRGRAAEHAPQAGHQVYLPDGDADADQHLHAWADGDTERDAITFAHQISYASANWQWKGVFAGPTQIVRRRAALVLQLPFRGLSC